MRGGRESWIERANPRQRARPRLLQRPLADEAATATDLPALPSWAAGTLNVVLEARAVGRPVVASRIGGIPDVVTHGRTGLPVSPRNVGTLGQALREALARPWDEARSPRRHRRRGRRARTSCIGCSRRRHSGTASGSQPEG
ncbi:glycosyltransferase [Sorangium sp. So ce295]|uniref:glycosyltransferase n=1 Tax=Sorangium sp. So ce295 TaxID=3133295 RepID=UPI003F5D60F2